MPVTPGIAHLQQQIDRSRHRILVYQRDDQILVGLGNSFSNYGLPVAGGNSSLVSNRYLQLSTADDPEIDIWWAQKGNAVAYSYPSPRLLDLLGITHLIAAEPLPYPDLQVELLGGDCSQTILPKAAGQAISGSFVPQKSAINRLDVEVKGAGSGSEETINVQLWEEADPPRLVLDSEAIITPGITEETLVFFFAPEREAPGKTYTWTIMFEPETSAALCADEKDDASVSVFGATWNSSYDGEFYIYERLLLLPKAYVVYATETIADDDQAVARLLDDAFSVDSQALTAEPVSLPNHNPLTYTPVTITTYQSDRIVMAATTMEKGLLVLRDQYHPGWKATIDGHEAPVLRVNHILRGVVLPPGTHEIVFTFQPTSLHMGLAISGLGLLLLLLGLILLRKVGPAH
jgi:hypothetical protein